jgi:(2Fe-2S) ferredoxin
MIVYPENWWSGRVEDEGVIDEIIDSLESGEAAQAFLIG